MADRIKIGPYEVTLVKLRRVRWPRGQWVAFSGNMEASGLTRDEAIYQFKLLARS